jgi:hypothetical protein
MGHNTGMAKLFVTGVSPVTMNDVSSGFNMAMNISLDSQVNNMLGFNETEVKEILDYYFTTEELKDHKDEALQIMKIWYDNYMFADNTNERVFNSDAVWYFVGKCLQRKSINFDYIDHNLRMDYGKLSNLVLQDRKLNGNFSVLTDIISNGGVFSNLNSSFPFDRLTRSDNYISLLFFLGLLTFSGKVYQGEPFLAIPNETIKQLIFEYIASAMELSSSFEFIPNKITAKVRELAYNGEFKPAFEYITKEINDLTSVRDAIREEIVAKSFFLFNYGRTNYYTIKSEMETNKKYADLTLIPCFYRHTDILYAYMIEFKYIKRDIKGKKLKPAIQEKIAQAKEQLDIYASDENVKKEMGIAPFGNITLKKIIAVYHGSQLVYCEEA